MKSREIIDNAPVEFVFLSEMLLNEEWSVSCNSQYIHQVAQALLNWAFCPKIQAPLPIVREWSMPLSADLPFKLNQNSRGNSYLKSPGTWCCNEWVLDREAGMSLFRPDRSWHVHIRAFLIQHVKHRSEMLAKRPWGSIRSQPEAGLPCLALMGETILSLNGTWWARVRWFPWGAPLYWGGRGEIFQVGVRGGVLFLDLKLINKWKNMKRKYDLRTIIEIIKLWVLLMLS